ncbi:malate dehydrogenase [Paecilomyces variotii No. 5]|uniref:Malate dehydrogenase n=1 Tax=Byssochlamys spectabilis (strain No. 5 / NBRC 109023) TaxID=1356009 RepID=V5G5J4_BYSSN|nr:malate dehydrogenase [Paecilomyces variotii No. 5]
MDAFLGLFLSCQLLLSAVGAVPLTATTWDSDTSSGSTKFAECTVRTTAVSPSLDQTKPQLPPPSAGLHLKYVTLGRGTQNYTCASPDASTAPVAVGAVATLFDASWISSSLPKLLDQVPPLLEQISLDNLTSAAGAVKIARGTRGRDLAIGKHYFLNPTTPFFDFRISGLDDWAATQKNASVNAPAPSSADVDDVPTPDVAWLQLVAKDGVGIKEVYRIVTAGGSPPATCEGQASSIEVQYAAQYWFYG